MNRTHNSLSMHCQKQYPNDVRQYVDMSNGACGLPNWDAIGFIGQFDTVLFLIGTLYSTCIWLLLSALCKVKLVMNVSLKYCTKNTLGS